jgi:hypothetical protein
MEMTDKQESEKKGKQGVETQKAHGTAVGFLY